MGFFLKAWKRCLCLWSLSSVWKRVLSKVSPRYATWLRVHPRCMRVSGCVLEIIKKSWRHHCDSQKSGVLAMALSSLVSWIFLHVLSYQRERAHPSGTHNETLNLAGSLQLHFLIWNSDLRASSRGVFPRDKYFNQGTEIPHSIFFVSVHSPEENWAPPNL